MKILIPLFILLIGVFIGFYFKRSSLKKWASKIIENIVYVLLFFLGISLGSSENFYENIVQIGKYALIISIICTIGSLIGARISYKLFFEKKEDPSSK